MSTMPRPSSIEAAPSTADRSPSSSIPSPNSLIAARVVRRLPKRSGTPGAYKPERPDARDRPQQLALTFDPPKGLAPRPARPEKPHPVTAAERFASLDQRMSTTDVLRVVGVNRSTIFRWVKRGLFPQRHASGGWLRSDVERWLSEKMRVSL
jgi:predicted DNA-binding transcriptional regulator AlpA